MGPHQSARLPRAGHLERGYDHHGPWGYRRDQSGAELRSGRLALLPGREPLPDAHRAHDECGVRSRCEPFRRNAPVRLGRCSWLRNDQEIRRPGYHLHRHGDTLLHHHGDVRGSSSARFVAPLDRRCPPGHFVARNSAGREAVSLAAREAVQSAVAGGGACHERADLHERHAPRQHHLLRARQHRADRRPRVRPESVRPELHLPQLPRRHRARQCHDRR